MDRGEDKLTGMPNVARLSTAQPPARTDSDTLLGGHGVLIIEHKGEAYYLRKTRNDKLILTK